MSWYPVHILDAFQTYFHYAIYMMRVILQIKFIFLKWLFLEENLRNTKFVLQRS